MEMITFKNFTVKYGDKTVFDGFNLDVSLSENTAVLGESGSGKTTLLNAIAGLVPFSGEVSGVPQRISAAFQENRLVPCLTVKENLALATGEEGIDYDLESFALSDKAQSYPSRLSGGEKRRVALLRAYRFNAPLYILDEPFNSLDLKLKIRLEELFKKRVKDNSAALLFVTHDIKEAVSLADRIIVVSGDCGVCKIVADVKSVNEKTEEYLFGLLSGKIKA
ncbi:MAG TPA: sulfonate ABC transporter ATP-binding protein [Clostridiales bacterium]|nr:sulfonate ABC transporter ATP-binding protein [Clostridiales bacterium]